MFNWSPCSCPKPSHLVIKSDHCTVGLESIESLRFLCSSEDTLGQGLLRKGGGEGGVSIYYLLINCVSMLLETGLSTSTAVPPPQEAS